MAEPRRDPTRPCYSCVHRLLDREVVRCAHPSSAWFEPADGYTLADYASLLLTAWDARRPLPRPRLLAWLLGLSGLCGPEGRHWDPAAAPAPAGPRATTHAGMRR